MIGLFQEHGPCRITNDSSSVTLNPYSWNNQANMLYIDQPVGTGFSYGETIVETSQEAASGVWTFMQLFFNDTRFTKYQQNEMAIWTESYEFRFSVMRAVLLTYFLSQNEAIASGSVDGYHLNLKVLGIGNGLTDPETQYPQYINYAESNPYHELVSNSTINTAYASLIANDGCQDRVYYVLTENPDPYPPNITTYLASIASQIGAEATWEESSDQVYANFHNGGDWMRTTLPALQSVVNAGDYICNYMGVEAMVDKLAANFSSSTYSQTEFSAWTVAGQQAGQYKEAGNFSYVRVFGAGHEVPAYKYGTLETGQAAAQMFTTVMSGGRFTQTSSSDALSATFRISPLAICISLVLAIL
ncbi:hypothetical protein H0H92_009427 [Tricholoma furcatifolium]|nr:hypothetical protein H0H92_009427 [Tricholoma furcatifolium]